MRRFVILMLSMLFILGFQDGCKYVNPIPAVWGFLV